MKRRGQFSISFKMLMKFAALFAILVIVAGGIIGVYYSDFEGGIGELIKSSAPKDVPTIGEGDFKGEDPGMQEAPEGSDLCIGGEIENKDCGDQLRGSGLCTEDEDGVAGCSMSGGEVSMCTGTIEADNCNELGESACKWIDECSMDREEEEDLSCPESACTVTIGDDRSVTGGPRGFTSEDGGYYDTRYDGPDEYSGLGQDCKLCVYSDTDKPGNVSDCRDADVSEETVHRGTTGSSGDLGDWRVTEAIVVPANPDCERPAKEPNLYIHYWYNRGALGDKILISVSAANRDTDEHNLIIGLWDEDGGHVESWAKFVSPGESWDLNYEGHMESFDGGFRVQMEYNYDGEAKDNEINVGCEDIPDYTAGMNPEEDNCNG